MNREQQLEKMMTFFRIRLAEEELKHASAEANVQCLQEEIQALNKELEDLRGDLDKKEDSVDPAK
jgi:hypothetical protein